MQFFFSKGDDSDDVWSGEFDDKEDALKAIHAISTGARGAVCVTRAWLPLPVQINTGRYTMPKKQADLAARTVAILGTSVRQGKCIFNLFMNFYMLSVYFFYNNT